MQFSYTMGDYKLANREYRMMYEQLYDEPRFVFEHGHALNKTGLYRESNAVLRQGSRLSSDPMFYNIMGNNYKMLGDYPAAAHYYQKAHDLLPNRLYPLYLLAKLYAETGQSDKAAEAAERVRQFDPKVTSSATRDMKEEIDKLIPAVCSPDHPDCVTERMQSYMAYDSISDESDAHK